MTSLRPLKAAVVAAVTVCMLSLPAASRADDRPTAAEMTALFAVIGHPVAGDIERSRTMLDGLIREWMPKQVAAGTIQPTQVDTVADAARAAFQGRADGLSAHARAVAAAEIRPQDVARVLEIYADPALKTLETHQAAIQQRFADRVKAGGEADARRAMYRAFMEAGLDPVGPAPPPLPEPRGFEAEALAFLEAEGSLDQFAERFGALMGQGMVGFMEALLPPEKRESVDPALMQQAISRGMTLVLLDLRRHMASALLPYLTLAEVKRLRALFSEPANQRVVAAVDKATNAAIEAQGPFWVLKLAVDSMGDGLEAAGC